MPRRPPFFGKYIHYTSTTLLLLNGFLLSIIILSASSLTIQKSYAHLQHFPHYNGGGDGVGKYYAYIGLTPEYAGPDELTQITFSIQDFNGNDVYNVETMVEIYEASTGQRIQAYPWTMRDIGDFNVNYVFPKIGNYQIVLSIANDYNSFVNRDNIDPPRNILSNTQACNCDRAVFNISISSNFGDIRNSMLFTAVMAPMILFGFVLGLSLLKQKKRGLASNLTRGELLKYSIMLLAMAGGMVHFAVFSGHGSLHIYYSIFLLAAGAAQIAYGILYVLITLTVEPIAFKSIEYAKIYYRKTKIVNLFGLIGTGVLIGLYTYSVLFPPPLSPTNEPEEVEITGILSKSLEIFLFIGVIYLMRWEKKKLQNQLINIK